MSGSADRPIDRVQARLGALLDARHPCITMTTDDELTAMQVLETCTRERGLPLLVWSCTEGVLAPPLIAGAGFKDTEPAAAGMYYFLQKVREPTVCIALDLAPHLSDPVVLRTVRETIAAIRSRGGALVMIDHSDDLPSVIASSAMHCEIDLPDGAEIESITRQTLQELHQTEPLRASLNRREFDAIIRNLSGLSRPVIRQIIMDCALADMRFDADDIDHVLEMKRTMLQGDGVLEFVRAPVNLDDIGGLATLKTWLANRERSLDDDARSFGLDPPRGVLLLGVQGAGKSLSAKAIATAWQRPLLRLDPGRLYDRYVGESERRLRQALHQAERMAPIVLWIDEIEKGFASSSSRSNDGGLSQRMFGTLLTWMQEHTHPVFLVATANDIEALPPELLRKGRFDEIFFVDLPDADVRRIIFEIHLRTRDRDPGDFDLDALMDASDGFSGAEIEQAVVSALHVAFTASTKLTTEGLLEQVRSSPPLSVTMADRIEQLRAWARTRCVPAN